MFSTFTTRGGHALIIRAVDIRRLQDTPQGCQIVWDECGVGARETIQGTAQENMDRLKAEETEALIAAERIRQRQQNGLPSMPVLRGRK